MKLKARATLLLDKLITYVYNSERKEAIKEIENLLLAKDTVEAIRDVIKNGAVNYWNDLGGLSTNTDKVQEIICHYDKETK